MCDGHIDCEDGEDEVGCGFDPSPAASDGLAVRDLKANPDETNATSVRVDWWVADSGNKDTITYRPAYRVVGTHRTNYAA